MSLGPLCAAWKGKYPTKMNPVHDDSFWKDRVKHEVSRAKDYKK